MVNSALNKQEPKRKLFYGLFIFPLLIAVGMAVLLCTIVLLTREVETPESLIVAIKTGSPSKRWQKAFELSNELNSSRGMIRATGIMKEVIHILNDTNEYDGKTRSYMAIALSRFESPEVVPALENALRKEADPEVQIYLLWSLGVKQSQASAGQIRPFLQSENEDLRKMAVYTLGALGDKESIRPLEGLLTDESRDIRWNAALSLARLGSEAGYDELVKMSSREILTAESLDEAKIEEIMINAVKGLALLGERSTPQLERLSKKEKSLKVRSVALQALDAKKEGIAA